MEAGYQRILLAAALLLPGLAPATALAAPEGLIPDLDRRTIKLAKIDNENFEVGIAGGLFSIEDFETNPVTVASLTYHITEDFSVAARYGQTTAGKSSFERLSGDALLLDEEDRDLRFYDLSLAVNLFPGEAFLWDRWAVSSSFYVIGGVGATEFAGNQSLTLNGGVGYRMIANDFLSLNFQVRDHVFDTEITGEAKATHNLELSFGLSVFF